MCDYCNYESDSNEIFQDWKDGSHYLSVQTSQWDNCDDDWVYEKIFINYCPYCGRDLYKK